MIVAFIQVVASIALAAACYNLGWYKGFKKGIGPSRIRSRLANERNPAWMYIDPNLPIIDSVGRDMPVDNSKSPVSNTDFRNGP